MGAHSIARIDRKSSIETEPRTLNMQQIDFAREAALYVVNTRSLEEAFKIFTEGLEPVAKMEGKDGILSMTDEENKNEHYSSCKTNQDQYAVPQFRDVLTAPF